MENEDEIHTKIRKFNEINEQFSINFKHIEDKKTLNREEKNNCLIEYIAKDIFVVPQYFLSVINTFSTEIPKLLCRAVLFNNEYPFTQPRHIANCVLLSKIVKVRPDLASYALKYFQNYPSPFEDESYDLVKSRKMSIVENIFIRDIDIIEASYFLLRSNPKFYRYKWKWTCFIKKYFKHRDSEVAWLSCQTIGIVLGLNERTLQTFIINRIPEDVNIKLTIDFDSKTGFSKQSQDTPVLDQRPLIPSKTTDLTEVVNIAGIYIPAIGFLRNEILIEVPSTYNNLRKLAIGLAANRTLCLQGPVGSGKTGLVDHLAAKTGRKLGETFVKIQLGDQTDSKMLLGTYRCTDIPGEFIWQPGVLTQAVIEGSWILLEDIDLASMDIASVLASLLENNALTVPGYRDLVPVTAGFQLIVTQRMITTMTGHHKKHSNAMSLLEKQLLQVTIDPLTNEELANILHVRYPQFDTIANKLINVFQLFSTNKTEETSFIRKSGRFISTRDFFKWCSRAAIDFEVNSQATALKVLQDAIDVFCCSYAEREEALNLAKQISTHLGIINQNAEYFFQKYKPTMQLTSNSLTAGRVSLKRDHSIYSKQAKFCFTRPAAVLLERVMCCIQFKEPVLLVGETGTGKTSSIQYLAHCLGKKLVVINMNQQSDSADLLGGYKPVDLKLIIAPIKKEFEELFGDFFKVEPNKKYLSQVAFCFNNQKYSELVKFMKKSTCAALKRLSSNLNTIKITDEQKKQKDEAFLKRWVVLSEKLEKLELQLKQKNALAFSFIEGSLVKAVQEGYWVLLDEINLANAETLECLSGLLEGTEGSLCLLERGDKQPVNRHPDFTLFACMNPATNIGKKDLPVGLRNRFTEFFVDELTERSDLTLLVQSYLEAMSLKEKDISKIVDFYLKIRKEMHTTLCDGLGHKPHFSLRSLCRALMIATKNPCGTFKRSLYEAFCLSFLTQLDSNSYKLVEELIARFMIGDQKSLKAVLKQPIPEPKKSGDTFLEFEGYWIKKGHLEPNVPEEYILTNLVRKNLKDLARVVSIGKLPVLLQGDTSVGKTSLITFLAKSSGNKCVRINNHEHTDLQEYIGCYVADTNGKLVFREGVLVEAMRKGDWIILDELNLAPTDVLEALNRVLDDNRELFIPETQETVKANSNFMLFATQNPPGAYGGRKMLSRAFRNRFVELHFNEIPSNELEHILHKRCAMAPSYARKMVNVMTDLQVRRRGSAAFAGKQGFITLRDLFRWGERYRLAQSPDNLYDWNQHLTDEGYLVLAGKVRKENEKKEIIEVLQKHWQREVKLDNLFSLHDKTSKVTKHILEKIENNSARYPNIVWTFNLRKLAVLVAKAMEFKEPVLLVGETGGGKTTICQLIADNNGQNLVIVNCHMHTESSDFIGGLRPVRDHSENKKSLFEWVDGPLLQAMINGSVFLADEISLADDSVLERLNSLLEPERTLLLAEKGIDLNNPNNSETIVAHPNFFFIGTMNPGGDFGKKELSPALRNRFTEIWCDSCTDRMDLIKIVEKNLLCGMENDFGNKMLDFIEWFKCKEIGKRYTISIRDVLTWVNFINASLNQLSPYQAYLHGAYLVFLNSLGSGVTSTESPKSLKKFKTDCESFLRSQIYISDNDSQIPLSESHTITLTDTRFGIPPFFIAVGSEIPAKSTFSFEAPTTVLNLLNLLRGMQLNKAILLEGSPGVGKTSLVTALAKYSRHKIFRVNLSDQTDISDLFGADLPVDGGTGGQFSWRDGPLLQALKIGSWILLDELNLASQSVLEGLNACLDHRGEIFIPELGKTFHVKTGTRFFGCQNPMKQGGSRRGLPKSFLNRFIQVFLSPFTSKDMEIILSNQFPTLPQELVAKMIEFNCRLGNELDNHAFGNKGAPWECNLRDLTRWCQAILYHFEMSPSETKFFSPESTAQLIYIDRMRSLRDKTQVENIFKDVLGSPIQGSDPVSYINKDRVYFGDSSILRAKNGPNDHVLKQGEGYLLLRGQLAVLRSLMYCVNQNWMAILVGSSGVGKSCVVKTLANLAGKTLKTLPVTSAMDTTDILGGFEQTNYSRHLEEIAKETERQTLATVQDLLMEEKLSKAVLLLEYWEEYLSISEIKSETLEAEVELFLRRISKLEGLLKELYLKCNSTSEGNMFLQLVDKCSRIYSEVNKDRSLSAGGRFEWVNSVLVKSLQEGSWLLVDNVNLCSAAVLDRLNALLEPNGVLTISEKGVDENGQMFEVKPHKDFRIFLTMDPQNGEISRAMRNRGVEIYMLNETEIVDSKQVDLKSLIDFKGLSEPKYINALLNIHQFISGLILSAKPGNTDILQCSSLISQQIKHGIAVTDSFYNTCIEVYYKTRCSSEFNCNNVLEVIKDGIKRYLEESNESETDWYNKNVTLRTRDLVRWSDFEKVKHQAAMYRQLVTDFRKTNKEAMLISKTIEKSKGFTEYVKGFRHVDKTRSAKDLTIWSDLEVIKHKSNVFHNNNFYLLANLLSNVYAISSIRDLPYRTLYLKNLVPLQEFKAAIERFDKAVSLFRREDISLPVDYRWTELFPHKKIDEVVCNSINVAMQVEIQKLRDMVELKLAAKQSLYQYLLLKEKNAVSDIFNSLICNNYLDLRNEYFVFLRQLTIKLKILPNDDFVKLLELLSWRQALQSFFTSVKLPESGIKNPMAIASKLNTVTLYYKWFYKYSVLELTQLLKVDLPDNLQEILSNVNKEVEKQFSPMYKVSKNFKKFNNVPEPFKKEWQLLAVKLIGNYDLTESKIDPKKTLSVFKNNPELRKLLVKLKCDVYSDNDSNDDLAALKAFHEKKADESSFRFYELEMLPLVDNLTQILLRYTVKNIESGNDFDLESLSGNILVPVELNGVLLRYKETGNRQLIHEIRKCYYLFSMCSASVNPNKFKYVVEDNGKRLFLSGIHPTISYIMNKLLVQLEDDSTTLSNFRDVQNQQRCLGLLLWNNMHSLSNKKFDYVSLQLSILKSNVKSFLGNLQESLKTTFYDFENVSFDDSKLIEAGVNDDVVQKNISNIFKIYGEVKNASDDISTNDLALLYIADLHILLGFTQAYINSYLPSVDPLAKKALKRNHISSVINMFDQMKHSFELQNHLFSNTDCSRHPYYESIKKIINELEEKVQEYGKNDSVGFKTYPYSYVVQQIHHAFDSVLNITILSNVIHCTSIISDLRNASLNGENYDIEQLKTYINRIESNVPSFERIFHDWKFYRSSYPDIVEPLLANVSQFLYGLKLKLYLLKRELLKYQFSIQYNVDLETELLNLATLPSLNENVSSLNKHAERYTGDRIRRFIDAILDEKEAPHIKATENLRLLKCGIQECFNQCVINTKNFENTERELLIKFKNLVNIFVDLWNMQQEKREQEKIESESLYKTRTKCDDKSEEEQIKEELMELFPNHHELDFSDLQKNTLTDSVGHTPKTEDMVSVISEEDLKFVIDLHATLFRNFIKTEWLCPESGKNIAPNFVTPLMEKYKLVRRIMDGHVYSLKYTIDAQLSGSLAVLLNVATHYGASNDLNETSLPTKFVTKEVKDFYKDSDVEEVKSCYHVLKDLKIKVNELLQRWSDQPTLNTILTVIERILNFNITSPVSRFLTGFDILLAKCHEWEEVAHSGVSLIEFSPNLINQIITWRKMELGRWKDLLNSTFENLKKPLSKWWLYMFNLMHQFVIEKKVAKPELIETIQKFMTTSNLVEFQGRLEIIFEFHCHAVTLAKTPEAESFINILWNLYNYFHQFSLSLNNKIKDLRAPIEKKLKEYVKIVKWKDVSYWAIKDTVDKSHKTLHKFIREYKDVLLQPVLSYLANPVSDNPTESVGIWDRPQRQSPKAYHYSLDADSYIVKASTKDLPYLSKARKICKETIHGTDYPVLVQSLDTFVTDVIETSAHLRNLEVDTSLPKEKQKSQAKNILQQKHRALAELFQNLTKIGVSYRSGIMDAKLKIAGEEFIIKPIDLSTSFGHLSYNRIDEKIFTIWDSCEMYYYRCLMRFDVLQTSLTVPARDLGIHNIERCRGFAAHLLTLCQEQKRDLVAATRSHYYLRNYAKQIRDCCENVSSISTSVLLQLQDALNSTSIVISQFKLILNSCPEEHSFDTRLLEIPILDPTSRSFQYKNDEIWDKAMQCIGNVSSVVSKIVTSLQKSNCSAPCTGHSLPKRTYLPYSQKTQLIEDLQKLVESISKLKEIFIPMKFSESLDWLVKMFIQILDECNKKPDKAKNISSTEHQSLFENFTKIILIVFQNLYKKYREASIIKHERTGEDNEVTLQENHLKSLVMQNLSTDIESLEIEKVLKLAKKILSALIGGSSYASEFLRTSASQCLPILDQIVQLSQYFITQQVATYRTTCKLTSILLNVFIDLASKGFCVPPELSDEIDKEGISKPSDGMGLGEGQGEKDVSDKIESEDQLDDAKPAGQEQENTEDPDCTEEDKGIEMSEDFDSKLQDKKTSGEDEENNESENSDAEEQMGETEKGADQLDREIWGSDKEDDGEGDDDSKQKEEKGEGGENEGEDQLGSNEDNSYKDKSKNKDPIDGQNEEKENSKKDINDMHEPEYDDEQTDPYHGNQPELPEPEPMDLPDDLQLDDGEENNGENPEENPFNIDEMKEQPVPDDKLDDSSKQNQEEGENDEEKEFSSDDEDITKKEGENLEGESADQTEEKKLDTEEKVEEPRESREGEDQDGTSTDLEEKALDQNPTNQENVEAMEVDEAKASDKTQATQSETLKSEQPIDELCQEDKPDKEGVGQSQMEKSESGHSVQTSAPQDASSSNVEQDKQERKKEKPGESDSKRSLGNVNQSIKKKLKTMDATTTEDSNKPNLEKEQTVDMYQHIKEATDQTTTQILDAATKEQAEEQRKETTHKDSENEDEPVESSTDVPAEKEEKMEVDIAEMKSEKQLISESKKEKIKNKQQHPEGDVMEDIQDVDIEGEIVKTATVPRGTDSFHHTQYHLLQENTLEKLTQEEVNAIRVDVEKQLSSWKTGPTSVEAEMAWQKISSVTSSLAQDLSEQLRLVLEPTQASHLKGDFRTGRRINMRKVIPYIASQFRKDKIWLRRTKPSKREYQIVLAIDDSSSMADNHSKELAFESVALVSKALSLLESGQLSVASFGEKTEVHHKLTDPFTDKSGVQLLQNFHFDQQKTCVGKLVNFVTEMFEQAQLKTSIPNAKLLLIVSDGRGVFSEGKTYVTQAVRRAKLANVFVVFIIIDSPENKNSILDIRSTIFKDGQFLGLQNYMDDFPFSFYIILRDINSLPGVLSDALMQWFEMVISQQ